MTQAIDIRPPSFSLKFGGNDICENVVSLTLRRAPLQFEGLNTITGTVEIIADDLLGYDPNPRTNREMFGEFAKVEFMLKNSLGVDIEPPFGGTLRVQKANYVKRNTGLLGEEEAISTLSIELVDILEYYRRPQEGFTEDSITVGSATPSTTLYSNSLFNNFGLTLHQEPADPWPSGQTDIPFTFRSKTGTLMDYIDRSLMGLGEEKHKLFKLFVDNQERVRIRRIDMNPATSEIVLTDDQLIACKNIEITSERLPGSVAGKSYFDRTTTEPTFSRTVLPRAGGGNLIITYDRGQDISQSSLVVAADGTKEQRDATITRYDLNDRETGKTTTGHRQELEVDGSDSTNLIPVSQTIVSYNYAANGEVRSRNTLVYEIERKLAVDYPDAGLDTASNNLIPFYELSESWRPIGGKNYSYVPAFTPYIRGASLQSVVPETTAEKSRPPTPSTKPNNINVTQISMISSAQLEYGAAQTIANPSNVSGEGTFSTTNGGSFTGFGTLTLNSGGVTVVTGGTQIWNGGATLVGVGRFSGTGIYTGTVFLGHIRDFDFQNHAANQLGLDILTLFEAQVLWGYTYGLNMQIDITAAGGAEVLPNPSVDAEIDGGTQTFTLSGETISLDADSILWGGTALILGARDGVGALTLDAQRRIEGIVGQGLEPLVGQSGQQLVGIG